MYGWTDPTEPERARPTGPPGEEPPYLDNGRPMPRSAYLFGDEPEQPRQTWSDAAPTVDRRHRRPSGSAARRSTDGTPGDGRHRSRRRGLPLLLTSTAAVSTLVVAVGVGTILLPSGEESGTTATTSREDPVVPPLPSVGALPTESGSPGPSPTTAGPTPSPSRSARPAPTAGRTTAPSRRTAERSQAPTARPAAPSPARATGGTEQAQIVALVNAERTKAGCRALTVDDKLTTAAQRHSEDQAAHRKMSHTGSDGSDAGDRLARVGYSWRAYGENVAWNQPTPAAVMDAWMNSSGHRANILNCTFTEIGVGVARSDGPYWTQVFGTPA